MSRTKIGVAAASVLAAGVMVLGGSALANAATSDSSGSTGSASSTANGTAGSRAPQGGTKGQAGGQGGSNDTAVSGAELTRVTAAVTAKDSAVTVTKVQKDPDGSYDAFGTKAGANVMYEVSADLATITTNTGGPGAGGGHGQGGSKDTAVTGSELTKVTAAVTAKDSTVTVTSVRKDPDGSYDVFGTKAGAKVMLEVSADLAAISTNTGGPGGGKAPNGQAPNGQAPSGQGTAPSTFGSATNSSSTSTANAAQV